MVYIASLNDAAPCRIMKPTQSPDGTPAHIFRSDIMVADDSRGPDTANAKLIEQPAGSTLQQHYHCVDQFQVIVGGAGWIGKHEVAPLTVHFASAYTGYGPIRAAEHGLDYLVFRLGIDRGAAYLPDSRANMKPGPRQYAISPRIAPTLPVFPRAEHIAIEAQPNGLNARIVQLPAGDKLCVQATAERGAFVYILDGSLAQDGATYGAGTCVALIAGEKVPLSAMQDARLLFMQFPRRHL